MGAHHNKCRVPKQFPELLAAFAAGSCRTAIVEALTRLNDVYLWLIRETRVFAEVRWLRVPLLCAGWQPGDIAAQTPTKVQGGLVERLLGDAGPQIEVVAGR